MEIGVTLKGNLNVSSYSSAPTLLFFRRMIPAGIAIWLFALVCVSVWSGGVGILYERALVAVTAPPAVCAQIETLAEFEKSQCLQFRRERNVMVGLALFPVILLGFIGGIATVHFHMGYRLAAQLLRSSEGLVCKARVKHVHPKGHRDLFSWFFCFRAIWFLRDDGTTVTAYEPMNAPLPAEGALYQIFTWGSVLTAGKRFAAPVSHHISAR